MNTTEKSEDKSIDRSSIDLLDVLLKRFPNMREQTKNRLKLRFTHLLSNFYDSMNK